MEPDNAVEDSCKDSTLIMHMQGAGNIFARMKALITDSMSSVDRKGLNYQDHELLFHINKHSPDVASGVHVGKDDLDDGAGDQSSVFRHARDETEDAAPLTHLTATRLRKKLSDARKNGDLQLFRHHDKTQMTIEHVPGFNGSLNHTVVTRKNDCESVVRDVAKNIGVDSFIDAEAQVATHSFNRETDLGFYTRPVLETSGDECVPLRVCSTVKGHRSV